MKSLSLEDFTHIIAGKLFAPKSIAQTKISRVATDSRTYFGGKNVVFFALTGPVNNGHDYILQLQGKGMKFFVVSDESVINEQAAFILVSNTQTALQKLAAWNRQQFSYPIIGITGSNGKTIIKEWLHDILAGDLNIVRSPKSFNSQVGVPLSILLMNEAPDLGIFEAGISKPGEMKNLQPVIAPTIGILTNIGDAHQENFTSIGQKLEEKLILFRNCQQLVFRIDDEKISLQTQEFCSINNIEEFSWTLSDRNARIKFSAKPEKNFTRLNAKTKNAEYQFLIPFSHESAIENACHCFTTLWALGKDPAEYLKSFEMLQPVAMRLEIKQGINNCLLINDYYNSDLNSLGIALSFLNQQETKKQIYKQVILSDIRQTGVPRKELYKKVNKLLVEWGVDKLIGIGPDIFSHKDVFTLDAVFFRTSTEFEHQFKRNEYKSSVILIKGARQFRFEKISGLLQQKAHQTVLEINLNALINNLNIFRNRLKPETKIMAMVKAFSYGSGDVEVARLLQNQNVDYLAVAVADEGVLLRNSGIATRIVVMNPEQDSFQNMVDYKLEPNIYSLGLLKDFSRAVSENGQYNYPIHMKIDSGMNRLGLKSEEEINEVIQALSKNKRLKIQSVFSHLAGSDEPAFDAFTQLQFNKFEQYSQLILQAFGYPIERHILNSAGIERFPEKQFEMARLGIGLYGISQTGLALESTGTLKSTISQVKTVTPEETVGYSRKGKVEHNSRIAIVPMGYADGLDRKLGNRNGKAFVNGKRVDIIGNICMDMLMLDITKIDAQPGDLVEFFGPNIPITELADKVGTIPYEILTGISQRVKRIYTQE